jgi:hypothetical protein
MSDEYSTCNECGAAVESTAKHRRWHDEINAKIDKAIREAKRAGAN